MICPYCNHNNLDEAVFCSKCGNKLNSKTIGSKNNKWHFICIVFLAVLVTATIICIVCSSKNRKDKSVYFDEEMYPVIDLESNMDDIFGSDSLPEKLKGKVKAVEGTYGTIVPYEINYNKNGDRIDIRFSGNSRYEYIKYEYDNQGNIVSRVSYDDDIIVDKYDYTNEYNGNGHTAKIMSGIIGYGEKEYDRDGNIIRQDYPRSDGYVSHTEYEYDGKGNLLKTISYCKEGENPYYSEYVYEYDRRGNLIRESYYDNDNNSLCRCLEYEYDKRGYIVSEKYYDATNNSIIYESEYENEYDRRGNIIKQSLKRNGELDWIIECEYDADDNLTKMVFSDGDMQNSNYISFEYGSFGI